MKFHKDVLRLDMESEIKEIAGAIRDAVLKTLKRKGAVVSVSGGIDSALCAALCTHALGKDNVLALFLPERDSSPESLRFGRLLIDKLGIHSETVEIAPLLEAAGCYHSQRQAVRMVFPEYNDGWKFKITLPSILSGNRLNISRLTVQMPNGEVTSERMPAAAYLQLVAATNFKQRTRKMLDYYHADRLNYAVCGTPNRLEYDQGFFVKGGDGLADFKPIAHLYKTQVYAMARALSVPDEICNRTPTTDTFSLPQTQEEFYFALPYDKMDLCLYAHNHEVPPAEVAPVVGLTLEQVEWVYRDIEVKRRTTRPLHLPALLMTDVPEITELKQEAVAHSLHN
ncbi:MAG: NAD(+) synthase [Bacteroidota bacterium]